jgi:hypothetical protein
MIRELIAFLRGVVANLVAFVLLAIFIALTPLVSVAVVVWVELDPLKNSQLLGWFIVCPFCVGIWYMFVAAMTRYARAKYFGATPRSGFCWAGARLICGWFVSQAAVIGFLFAQRAFFGEADGGNAAVQIVAPLLLLVAWSPVLVNLTRHFFRRYPNVRRHASADSLEQLYNA